MPRRGTIVPVFAGAPSVELIEAGLSLLLFLSDPKAQKTAKATLEALQAASAANQKALAVFPAANRIVEAEEAAEADRAAAAQELADAKAEAGTIVSNANGKADGRIALLDARDLDLIERERALESRTATQDRREAAFERESAKLRAALKI